jgi:hypothetical protein
MSVIIAVTRRSYQRNRYTFGYALPGFISQAVLALLMHQLKPARHYTLVHITLAVMSPLCHKVSDALIYPLI